MNRVIAGLVSAGLITGGLMIGSQSYAQTGQPKNVQVLKGKNTKEIRHVMKGITGALGVKCIFCHNPKDYSSDEKPKKLVGREFLKMVGETNKQIAAINRSVMKKSKLTSVTCFTCHQGDLEVASAPE